MKFQLIRQFGNSPLHCYNVMKILHYSCEEDLNNHLDLISNANEWGTDVVLAILGSLAEIDVLVINATHTNPNMWRVDTIYAHDTLSSTTQSNPVFSGQTSLFKLLVSVVIIIDSYIVNIQRND